MVENVHKILYFGEKKGHEHLNIFPQSEIKALHAKERNSLLSRIAFQTDSKPLMNVFSFKAIKKWFIW
jgi:hypothetical protein